jgi:sirohydrochlorin cobaltochelatase
MEQMWEDGIREVLVQPTHVIDGLENDRMKEDIQGCAAGFERIVFGEPLLTARGDHREIFPAVMSEFSQLRKEEALVFMGHGTAHEINAVYEELDAEFKKLGYTNVFLGTVEASPTLEELLVKVEKLKPKKIFLAPFMLVAGAHALEDMSGEAEDSWKNRFQRAGYPVECVLKGLGEYEKIRSIYVRHAKNAGR